MPTFIFWLVIIIMVIGALGTLFPVIPGTPIIFLAALGYGFYEGFHLVTPSLLAILFVLMALTLAADYFAGVIGAKKYGASKYGTWGSFIGAILGVILFNIPGLVIGPFAGAVAGELVSGKKVEESLKIGFGAVIGLAGGAVFKLLLAIVMIIMYLKIVIQ